ncbi:helix-turn-helix domain-containing protein [soil metagenome]|nr:helix-turn-helix domain-containing protein [Actinomycetota bacterium]
MQRTGLGPALRKARLLRGKSIEEASRETRIRADFLHALEGERYETLLGQVYARGFLRSYSTYLGLDADKVLGVYNRHFGRPGLALPEPAPGPVQRPPSPHPHLPSAVRNHPSWSFLIVLALSAVALFAATGLFRPESAPSPGASLERAGAIRVLPPKVTVALKALEPVTAVVTVDGETRAYRLEQDEAISFEGEVGIEVQIARGGVAELTVNGQSIGALGEPDAVFRASFRPPESEASPSDVSS